MSGVLSSRSIRGLATVIWLGALTALWFQRGLFDDKEAMKYLGCADQVLHGDFHDLLGNYLKYGAYVLFLVPFVALGETWLAIVAQAVLAWLSARAVSRLAVHVGGDARGGDFAFVVILLCFPLQQWVLGYYTESFFTSVAMLFIARFWLQENTDALTVFLACATVFARPVGMLFVLPCVLGRMLGRSWLRRPIWVQPIPYIAFLVAATLIPGIARDQLTPIVEGHVICGFPELPQAMEGFAGTSIFDAQCHLFAEQGAPYAIGLFFRRLASFFVLMKPYFSTGHNAFLAAHYALLGLALAGLWLWRSVMVVRSLWWMILLNALVVALTHDEWSGRFFVPLWPLVGLLSSLAFIRLGSRFLGESRGDTGP